MLYAKPAISLSYYCFGKIRASGEDSAIDSWIANYFKTKEAEQLEFYGTVGNEQ